MIHQTEYEEIIVCLYDGHFDLGIAAFANSLVKFNYKGLVNVGYRGGSHPEWVNQLKAIGPDLYLLSEHITIRFTEVKTNMHLGYYKPFFIKETFEAYPTTDKLYYFDADIVVNCPWDVFSRWRSVEHDRVPQPRAERHRPGGRSGFSTARTALQPAGQSRVGASTQLVHGGQL